MPMTSTTCFRSCRAPISPRSAICSASCAMACTCVPSALACVGSATYSLENVDLSGKLRRRAARNHMTGGWLRLFVLAVLFCAVGYAIAPFSYGDHRLLVPRNGELDAIQQTLLFADRTQTLLSNPRAY